jgi:hypothetical protein
MIAVESLMNLDSHGRISKKKGMTSNGMICLKVSGLILGYMVTARCSTSAKRTRSLQIGLVVNGNSITRNFVFLPEDKT